MEQTGMFHKYLKEFERIASRVHEWPEKALVGTFIGGLKADIASEVRVHGPRTYAKAVDIARIYNDHLRTVKTGRNMMEIERLEEIVMDGGGIDAWKGQLRPVDRLNSPGMRHLTLDEMQR
ncbi:hypothetical protein ACS0TY_020931 [Phlomoides rotata]